jgi:PAS domain S-box-containing protein
MRITQPNHDYYPAEGGGMMGLSKLLSRQLKKYLGGLLPRTGKLRDFIYAINDSYNHLERDRVLLERSMDISFNELKESNRKLVESESMFFDMALNVPGMLYQFILRPNGWMEFPYVSAGSMDLLGLSPEEIMQDAVPALKMVYEEDRKAFYDSLGLSSGTLNAWHWFGRVQLASGQMKWIKGKSRPRRLPDGSILWNGLLIDITESKQNEEKLQLFRNLVEQSNDAVFVTDVETSQFLDVNEKACSSLGYSKSELLTMRVLDIEAIITQKSQWEKHIQEIETQGYLIIESEHRRKDGSVFSVEMNIKHIVEDKKRYSIGIARDITERKLAQKALKEKEKFLEQIINANHNLIFVKNARGEYTMANEAFAKVHHTTVAELIGKTDADFHPYAQEIALFRQQDQEVIESLQTTLSFELSMQDATTGAITYFQSIKMPLVAEDGLIQVLGVATDITERKLATEELHRQKAFYETFLNNAPIDLAVFDPQGRYLYVNPKSIKNDTVRSWLIGKDDFEYCQFRKKDMAIAQQRRAFFHLAASESRVVEMTEIMYDQAGKRRFNLRRFSPVFDDEGQLKMMLGYGLDITERVLAEEKVRESEQLLQSINSNIQVGICRSTMANQLIYVNEGFANLFGFGSVQEVLQTSPEFLYENIIDLNKLMESTTEVVNRELIFHKKDGTFFWGLISITKIEDTNSQIFYDGVMRDITELKQSEELLRYKNAELEKTNAELDRFVYSASHELRAPLTSVLGLIGISKMEQKDAQQVTYLNMMEQSVNRLDRFIQDIIHYSRNSRLDIQPQVIDFQELLRETLEDLNYMQVIENIDKIIHIESPTEYKSDRGRLRVILNNLVSNAIRYHRLMQEHPYIEINVRIKPEKAIIQVSDNGQGISPEHLDKIFDMFYRASNSAKGSGLGLYIVKETLIKLQGTISVKSEYKKGTTFTLHIPNLSYELLT